MGLKKHYTENRNKSIFSDYTNNIPRRDFVKKLSVGSTSIFMLGCWIVKESHSQEAANFALLVVDYNKCTGCRTCEAACVLVQTIKSKEYINSDKIMNHHNSSIRVFYFNPPVDIPVHCMMCKGTPCIEACPVEPDKETGRKALYRDEKTFAIKNDFNRCIGCGQCAEVCTEQRIGAILINSDTGKPDGICDLCDGNPACVEKCPFGALSYRRSGIEGRDYAKAPEKIAQELIKLWYYHQ